MLGVHNMVRNFIRCPQYWLQQPVYQTRKVGRPPRQSLSYRDLCLWHVELRIVEELWAARSVIHTYIMAYIICQSSEYDDL